MYVHLNEIPAEIREKTRKAATVVDQQSLPSWAQNQQK
jgi:hypothetical protein